MCVCLCVCVCVCVCVCHSVFVNQSVHCHICPTKDDIAESDRSLLQHQNATNSATVPSGIVSTPSRSKKPILPTGVRSVEFQMSRSNGTSSSPMAASKAVDVRKKAISKEQQG